ncbi:N-acetylmuramate alpha-1-phosphate uridylyltransferase MurU [Iodobacter fluviatilis]|uniref:Glucose-1-phosphate thymidylyltransferase 1 n=1 Tax=Iodobacter fluviatilis TaxID=537 RepID=A0A377SY08_9NEIS|nr:nucleotidyltransferase family protein [Iodobacter fluviatilis]TCU87879.1 MurNAc alpha-1-phosphate uridylyltransferase [Iodobacter fluviatilis]STR45379.1 Glucose-1-phosphate thymidylyltransferase 1 [Iodobacter fluviatilis]
MKAMILAAGRGERMRPLTDTCPKPLLEVGGTPLIGWHLHRLAAAGITEVVINHAWLGAMIEERLGDGSAYGVRIQYSAEDVALETAGGIAKALPLLGDEPFLLISADIFTDFDLHRLLAYAKTMDQNHVAHLVMVPNPEYHPLGDFALENGLIVPNGAEKYCYGNLAICRAGLLADVVLGEKAKLGPMLAKYAAEGRVSGEYFEGTWVNVGTPADLQQADTLVREGNGKLLGV